MISKYPGPPGPGAYTLLGDFDFRDPTLQEEVLDKTA